MRLRNFVFFRPPGDDNSERHRRILRAIGERLKSFADHGDKGTFSRRDKRISGIEEGGSEPSLGKLNISEQKPSMGTPVPLSRARMISPPERGEKLDAIRSKIASGYYRTPGHLKELADVLLEKIDFFGVPDDPLDRDLDDESRE